MEEDVFRIHGEPLPRFNVDEFGYLRANAILSSAGVFPYRLDDGSIRYELKPEEELFSANSIETAEGAPFTDDHPPVLITAKNASQYAKGFVSHVAKGEGALGGKVTAHDERINSAITAGEKAELSPAYRTKLVFQSGTWKGQHYDAIQTNIRYNHFALVDEGREGEAVRLLTQNTGLGVGHLVRTKEMAKPNRPLTELVSIRLNGVDYSTPAAVKQQLEAYKKNAEDAANQAASLQAQLDALKNIDTSAVTGAANTPEAIMELAKLKAMLDQLNATVASLTTENADLKDQVEAKDDQLAAATDPEAMNAAFKEHSLVMSAAEKAIQDYDPGKKNLIQIKQDVAEAVLETKLNAKDTAEVEAHYKAAVKVLAQTRTNSEDGDGGAVDVNTLRENVAAFRKNRMNRYVKADMGKGK